MEPEKYLLARKIPLLPFLKSCLRFVVILPRSVVVWSSEWQKHIWKNTNIAEFHILLHKFTSGLSQFADYDGTSARTEPRFALLASKREVLIAVRSRWMGPAKKLSVTGCSLASVHAMSNGLYKSNRMLLSSFMTYLKSCNKVWQRTRKSSLSQLDINSFVRRSLCFGLRRSR